MADNIWRRTKEIEADKRDFGREQEKFLREFGLGHYIWRLDWLDDYYTGIGDIKKQ